MNDLRYICTLPNLYYYKGIEVTTCDIFFVAKANTDKLNLEKSEIAQAFWMEKENLDPEKFAFISHSRSNEVEVIDLENNELLDETIPVGKSPKVMVFVTTRDN